MVALPLLLLRSGSEHVGASVAQVEGGTRVAAGGPARPGAGAAARDAVATGTARSAAGLLPAWQLVHFTDAPTPAAVSQPASATTSAATTTTTAPPTTTTAPPPTTITTAPPPPPNTTTTAPTSPDKGIATWYPEAAPGKCASPFLPFGTELTVTSQSTGATTTCVVDDREADNPGRVVDLSYSGFSQIADPSQGIVEVTISW